MRICNLAVIASFCVVVGATERPLSADELPPENGAISSISEIVQKAEGGNTGTDLLSWVNKDSSHSLAPEWQPSDLVALKPRFMAPGHRGQLREQAAAALTKLMVAAKSKRLSLRVRSGYRSYRRQRSVYRSKVRKFGERRATHISAQAGHSQHQLGTTVDFSVARLKWRLSPRLARRPAGKWLQKNAYQFGFVQSYPKHQRKRTGYAFEPWHYRYIGPAAAEEMRNEGLLLEHYLKRCHQADAKLRCPRS